MKGIKKNMATYTFEDAIFSDLCKEVYGVRAPARAGGHLNRFYHECDEEKQKIWDELCAQLDVVQAEEAAKEKDDIAAFEARVAKTIALGAENRETALKWIVQSEDLDDYNYMPGHAAWIFNLPHSYDKELDVHVINNGEETA